MDTEHGSRVATRRVGLIVTVLVAAIGLGACGTSSNTHGGSAEPAATVAVERPAVVEPGTTHDVGLGDETAGRTATSAGRRPGSPAHHDAAIGDAETSSVKALHREGEVVDPEVGVGAFDSLEQFMEFVLFDANDYWQGVFADYGIPAPSTYYLFPAPGDSYDSSCGFTDDSTAHYCIQDDEIVISQQRAYDEAMNVVDEVGLGAGDMAVAFIVAHEFAHSLQDELGFFDGRYTTLQTELQADCWAGVWSRSASDRGMLDDDDLLEAAVLAWAVGSPNTPERDHGTSQERVDAFFHGFDTGHPLMCGEELEAQP